MNKQILELFQAFGPGSPTRYLTDTETLRLTVFNAASGVRVALRGRKIDENGESRFASNEGTPTTARAASIVEVQPGAGWLVGAAALVVAGSPLDGQTYAVLSIGIGTGTNFTETEVLAAGTISSAKRIAWPGGGIIGPLDGAGALRSITGTTPAAGADIAETVPTGARWSLIAFHALLTTGAAVANRFPRFVFDDGTNTFWNTPQGVAHAASLAIHYATSQGLTGNFSDSLTTYFQAAPAGLELGPAFRIRTVTAAIQAADQWSAVQYLVREKMEGN